MNIENLILILFFGFIAVVSFARNSAENGESENKTRRRIRQGRPQGRPSPGGDTPLPGGGREPEEDLDRYQLEARRFVEELKRKAAGAQAEGRANAEVSPLPNPPAPRGGGQSAKPAGRAERKFRSAPPHKAEASMEERLSSAAAALKNSEALLSEALRKSRTAGTAARSGEPFGDANAGAQTDIAETLSVLRARVLDADGRRKLLRSAFVMSEIISKPVALRGGTGAHKW